MPYKKEGVPRKEAAKRYAGRYLKEDHAPHPLTPAEVAEEEEEVFRRAKVTPDMPEKEWLRRMNKAIREVRRERIEKRKKEGRKK